MKTKNILEALEPRQIKAIAAAVFAVIGLTLTIVAFGVASDHGSLAKQMVEALSHGPIAEVVHAIYIK